MMNDTIAAVSTALGVGAISIIRISGSEAINIVNKLFKEKDLSSVLSHTIHYGHINDGNDLVDEVLVSVMRSPKTFTLEDIVEINCHGGIDITNKVLALVLSNGARLAEPGEFSKRAFLNGRIDLVEAEGIMDLINAKTEKMRKLALNQVGGDVSRLVRTLRNKVRDILINIDVNIDYPEYEDILVITKEMIRKNLVDIKKEAKRILKESENGKIIKYGIKTIIVGRPNVGKSSLLNRLIDEDKAIVTDIPGTTRDIVEGNINLDGILLNVVDTAGIRETSDKIEQIGVSKSIKMLEEADLVIIVINNNEVITVDDLDLLNKTDKINSIVFVNKNDLESKVDTSLLDDKTIVYGNTMLGDGTNELKIRIKEMFNIDEIEQNDLTYLSSARQIGILSETLDIIEEIDTSLSNDVPVDILAIDLKNVFELLGDIIGENFNEELIDELFKQFCLGK